MNRLRGRLRVPHVIRAWIERFFESEGIDRSIVLASQAFTAFFPLLIVYSSIAPTTSSGDFADGLIERFDLSGAAADSVRRAFAPPDAVESSVTIVSVLFLLVAALAFTRSFQRVYERAWRLEGLGMRGTKWGLIWLGAIAIAYSLRPASGVPLDPLFDTILTLTVSASIWLMTPYLLLGRRLAWRRLLPSAVLTALTMTCLGVGSIIYMPHNVESSAERFGVIGVAFALLGWLVACAFAITGSATAGAVVTEELARHSGWKLTQYLTLEYEQPTNCEGGKEDGAEDRLHRGERRPREYGEQDERSDAPHGA